MQNQKALIIGCGIAGPAMAIFLKRIGIKSIIYEARKTTEKDAGVFMGITPNGLNILKEIFPIENLLSEFTPGSMQFLNSKNKRIGRIDTSYQRTAFGSETIQIKRSLLSTQLCEAAMVDGIEINYGKKLKSVTQTGNFVTVYFEDGTEAVADMLIACDGIHSGTRKSVFPDAPRLSYTGLLSTGGYSKIETTNLPKDAINMIFGERAFFAYAISNKDEIWWFNNIARDREPERNELNGIEQEQLIDSLIFLHRNDPALINDIIRATDRVEVYPIFDIPSLKKWYKGRICLIGDAAHATAPHIGQGASLALEDTLVLARCIHESDDHETAFQLFENSRRQRVEKIIAGARKIGKNKTAPNKFQQFFRDLFLPVFVKMEAKKLDWIYGYTVR